MNLFTKIKHSRTAAVILIVIMSLASIVAGAQPVISSISPASATAGSNITINGAGFNAAPINNTVYIGGMKANILVGTSATLVVTVPKGAAYGPVTVTNMATALTGYSRQLFMPISTTAKNIFTRSDLTYDGYSGFNFRLLGMSSADLTGDGKPDLILNDNGYTASADNVLSLLANTSTQGGAISFAAANTYTVAGYNGLAEPGIADFDGDGRLDILSPAVSFVPATSTHTQADVYVYRNTNGNLASMSRVGPFPLSLNPMKATGIDIDGDGKPDAVTSNYQSHSISILLNQSSGVGNIAFGTETTIPMGTSQGTSQIADIDGDGKPDIVSANVASTQIQVLRNTSTPGSVSFAPSVTISVGFSVVDLKLGDIDGDGNLDIVAASVGASTSLRVFRNTSGIGSITFALPVTIAVGNSQQIVNLGDVNGDGKLDVAVGANTSNQVIIFRNTSSVNSISFDMTDKAVITELTSFPGILGIADFNADGNNDLLVGATNLGRLFMYRNIPQSPPVISTITPATAAPGTNITLTGNNFNSTAANNVVYFGATRGTVTAATTTSLTVTVPVGASYGPLSILNTATWLSSKSILAFTPAFTPNKSVLLATDFTAQTTITSSGSSISGAVAADLDNDKKADIIETDYSGDKLFIRKNNGTAGTVSFAAAVSIDLSATGGPGSPAVGDLDGDGNPDIVVTSVTGKVVVIRNTGNIATMAPTTSYTTGANPTAVAIGDIDGDGRADIVVANSTSHTISVLRNISTGTGTISFDAKIDYAVGADAINALFIADLDGDGKADIVTQNSTTAAIPASYISVFRNTSIVGTVSLAAREDITTLQAPWGMAVGDIDGDQLADIIVSGSANGNTSFSVFRNTSVSPSITFAARQDINAGKPQKWVSLGDLNGDGKTDVLLSMIETSGTNYQVAAFANTSTGGTISFDTRVDLAAEAQPQTGIIQDMDGDGRPDILSANYDNHTISVYRNSLIAAPVTQAASIAVTTTGTTANIGWTNGSGGKRAVFVLEGNAGQAVPSNNTDYTPNATFGSGSQIGVTGWYCVYNGTGTSVNVSGLTASVTYRVMVTEFNDGGLTGVAQYQVAAATNNPVNFTTRATISSIARASSSPANTATVDYTVTFGSTVSGLTTSNFTIATTGGIAGAAIAGVTGSGTTYTVTVNTGSGDGTIGLNLANASGLTPLLTNTLPFTGEIYTIDKTAPTLSTVTVSSSNTNTARAKTGDVITIDFTANENVSTPVVTIASNAAAVVNTSGNDWRATYTMTASDVEGVVPFSIGFSDIAGNAGTAVTATTNSSNVTFEKTLPVLSAVTIASDHTNTAYAKPGNAVTLDFTASKTIGTPTVTIAGHPATATNTSGNSWKAVYTMIPGDTEGDLSFSIAFADLSGNTGTTVSATTNSSKVTFDKTAPVLNTVTIASANTNTLLAKTGDLVTLTFTAGESIGAPVVTIAGHTVTATNGSGNNWTATYTMAAADAEGNISFSIAYNDLAGNAGTTVSATTNSSNVLFDRTVPVLNTATITSSNSNAGRARSGDQITLNFTSSETIGVPVVMIAGHTVTATNNSANNWTSTYTMTAADADGNIGFSITFSDVTGNAGTTVTASTNSSNVLFDKTSPVLSAVTIASNNNNTARAKTGDLVILNFTANEAIGSPVVTIAGHGVTVVNNSGNSWTASYTMTASDAEGNVGFSITFSDVTGNAGTMVTATTNSSNVLFDKTSPVLSAVAIASNNNNTARAKTGDLVTLNFTANEAIGSPVVTIAGHGVTAVNNSSNSWTASYTMTASDAEGNVGFSIAFNDIAGNAGVTTVATTNGSNVIFDRTAPQLPVVTIASGNANPARAGIGDQITLQFTASEIINTPVMSIAGHVVAATNTGGNNWTATYTMTTADPNGIVAFNITFSDLTGNTGTGVTTTTNGSTVLYTKFVNTAPAFTGGTAQTLSICQDAAITPVNNMLGVADPDNGQTLNWTIASAPAHGTLTGFPATAMISSSPVIPTGLSYRPAPGYNGPDAFAITVSDGTNTSTVTITVTVNATPSGNITVNGGTILCTGNNITLSATGGSSYQWYRDGIQMNGAAAAQLPVTNAGVYTAKLISAAGCEAMAGNNISIAAQVNKPVPAFTMAAASCINLAVQTVNNSAATGSGVVDILWSDGNGGTSTAVSPAFTYNQPGSYTVKLKITPRDCPAVADSITRVIQVEQPVTAVRLAQKDVASGTPVTLQARNTPNVVNYSWTPATNLSSATIANPVINTTVQTEYQISMRTAAGCTTVDTLLVRVQSVNGPYMPNVFTPNGDGQNDKLMPVYVGTNGIYYFRVYDRTGRLLFETSNMGEGWDGTYKGQMQPVDTYTWVITGMDITGKPFNKRGSVTLLR